MRTFAAKEAKDGFGLLLDTAQREPVVIEKKGRPVAVVVSITDYERLESLEDAYWADRARKAVAGGFLNAAKSRDLVSEMLNAENRNLKGRRESAKAIARKASPSNRRKNP